MKYIAYFGAFATSILCIVILGMLMLIMAQNHAHSLIECIGMLVAIPIVCFISVASAWIICDMQKRMKEM